MMIARSDGPNEPTQISADRAGRRTAAVRQIQRHDEEDRVPRGRQRHGLRSHGHVLRDAVVVIPEDTPAPSGLRTTWPTSQNGESDREEVPLTPISRGFGGRRRSTGDDAVAGSAGAVPDRGLPGALRRADAARRPGRVGLHRQRRGRRRPLVDLGRVPGAAAGDDHRRHPLRDEVVEARHHLDRRLGRHAARRRRDERRVRDGVVATAATRRTCRSRICSAARRGSRSSTTTSRSSPSTAGRHGCSFRISTSGRAPSGCAGLELKLEDEPGFWESYGYHNYGDPWQEQRYYGD